MWEHAWEALLTRSITSGLKPFSIFSSIFPSPDQSMSLPQYQSCQDSGFGPGLGSSLNSVLNTGGSLPDLTSLHFPSPLSMPLDSEENYSNNLPHAMMHLGTTLIWAKNVPRQQPETTHGLSLKYKEKQSEKKCSKIQKSHKLWKASRKCGTFMSQSSTK